MFDFNFNNVPEVELIPAGTVVKARLNLRPGDSDKDQYLKKAKTGSLYLDCEFTVIEGEYAKRKIYHKIGIEGNDVWVAASRRFIKNILESAKGISKNDKSPEAEKARQITYFSDLDGLDVLIKVGVETGGEYADKNRIVSVITAENPIYQQMMSDGIPW